MDSFTDLLALSIKFYAISFLKNKTHWSSSHIFVYLFFCVCKFVCINCFIHLLVFKNTRKYRKSSKMSMKSESEQTIEKNVMNELKANWRISERPNLIDRLYCDEAWRNQCHQNGGQCKTNGKYIECFFGKNVSECRQIIVNSFDHIHMTALFQMLWHFSLCFGRFALLLN